MFTGLYTGVDKYLGSPDFLDVALGISRSSCGHSTTARPIQPHRAQPPSRYPGRPPALYTISSTWARIFHCQYPRCTSHSSTEPTRPTPTPTAPDPLFIKNIYKRRASGSQHNGRMMLSNQGDQLSIGNLFSRTTRNRPTGVLMENVDRTGK